MADMLSSAQTPDSNKVEWHGYTQLRFATNFNSYNNFSVRRLKFWIKSGHGFPKHWSYKVQAIFMSVQDEKFFLQDIYEQYNWKNSSIRFGQFIPQFSLQRFQSDYLIPSSERARAVNLIIPDGTHGVRDIGIQYNFKTTNGKLDFNIGVFNGYGIKEYRFDNTGFLSIQHLSYQFNIKKSTLKFGYSLSYRMAEDMYFKGIIPDTILYSGSDIRYNFYGIFTSNIIDFQTEYLNAVLETGRSAGYYALLTIKPSIDKHIFLLYDKYTSDDMLTNKNPWYVIGCNYLINKYRIMISLETGFQKIINKWSNRTVFQFQMFLH
ncbi:MAG: hypothetical protein GXO88_01215 [Chlorobi bacterium]|nr:hypothetical protein [Chlorobiota bacterium]